MRNRIFAILLVLCMVAGIVPAAASGEITVFVNQEEVLFDQPPVLENDRTLVPVRAIFEALDTTVTWNEDTKEVTAEKNGTNILLTIDSSTAYVNGKDYTLDVPPRIIGDRTLVPLRFISDSLDCHVAWKDSTNTVYITSGEEKPVRNLEVHFINVGQADSILVLLPNGETLLIDAGKNGDGKLVTNYLKLEDVETVDYLVGTHPHEDHIGGLDTVIETFSIGNLYLPNVQADTKTFLDVLTAAKDKGLTVKTAKAGTMLYDRNGLTVELLSPAAEKYSDLNDYSAVVKVTYLNRAFLFMGDAGTKIEGEISGDISADVLKVGHHGSNTATSEVFLNRVAPAYAVISVGEKNSYGHPAPEVLDLLEAHHVTVFRTDINGTVIFSSDGDKLDIMFGDDRIVYVTKTGKKYHLEGCEALSRSKIEMRLGDARLQYAPCSLCNPPE